MSQVTHGIRSLLSTSRIYNLFQWILGGKDGRANFTTQYLRAQVDDFILDIGCGTADIRKYLPNVQYYGFDPSSNYIDTAKTNLRGIPGCNLYCASLDEAKLITLPKFDIVLAIGVLHHLSDEGVIQLAHLAKSALKHNGRLITLDPCYVEGQSIISRLLIKCDRGQNVRTREGYERLMSKSFNTVVSDIRHDFNRFPYTHFIMECVNK